MRRIVINYIQFLSCMMLFSLIGCEKMEIKESGQSMPENSQLKVDYDFGNLQLNAIPDSVYLFASRLFDVKHYSYVTASNGQVICEKSSEASLGEQERVNRNLSDYNMEGSNLHKSTYIESGEYSMLALACNNKNIKIGGTDDFMLSPSSFGLKKLYLECMGMEKGEMPIWNGESWIEQYPDNIDKKCPFIQRITPVYVARVNKIEVPVSGGSVTPCFKFEKLTKTLDIKFNIKVVPDANFNYTISSTEGICSEVSGVATSMQAVDRKVHPETFARMFVDGALTKNEDLYAYQGSLETLGFVASGDKTAYSGPGIIRVAFKINLTDKKTQKSVTRVVYAANNINEELKASGMMEPYTGMADVESLSSYAVTIKKDLVIDIKSILTNTNAITGWPQSFIVEK